MVIIMPRDIILFKLMRVGPAKILYLLRKLHELEDFKTVTLDAIRQRIFLLIGDGYLGSRYYPKYQFALYALTEKSIQELVNTGIAVETIRAVLPSAHTVLHELTVTKVLRAFYDDSVRCGYTFTHVDENLLKQKYRSDKRKGFLPDLMLRLRLASGSAVTMRVEIDRGTVPAFLVSKKIEKLVTEKIVFIVLCDQRRRMETLIDAVIKYTLLKMQKKSDNLFLGLTTDFCKSGLGGTSFYRIDSNDVRIRLT